MISCLFFLSFFCSSVSSSFSSPSSSSSFSSFSSVVSFFFYLSRPVAFSFFFFSFFAIFSSAFCSRVIFSAFSTSFSAFLTDFSTLFKAISLVVSYSSLLISFIALAGLLSSFSTDSWFFLILDLAFFILSSPSFRSSLSLARCFLAVFKCWRSFLVTWGLISSSSYWSARSFSHLSSSKALTCLCFF